MSGLHCFVAVILWLALTLPVGALLSRSVLRLPRINPAFEISRWFFLGLAVDIFVLNALQWWPVRLPAAWALAVLGGMNFIALIAVSREKGYWPWKRDVNQAGEQGSWRRLVPSIKRISTGLETFSTGQILSLLGLGLLGILLLWLSLKTALTAPLLGWDAWSGWVAKAKIWHAHGFGASVVSPRQWLLLPVQARQFSSHMWHYPDAIGLLYAVSAPLFGSVERSAAVLWPLVTFFLGLGMAGLLWFCTALRPATSTLLSLLMFVLLIGTPLWATHTALPGYADILLAAFLWQAVVHFALAIHLDCKRYYLAAAVFVVVLPFIKLFGWVILVILLASLALVNPAWRRRFLKALVLFFFFLALLGFFLPIEVNTEAGPLVFRPDYLLLPGYGRINLGWHFSGMAWLQGLFLSQNWLFVWFGLPAVIWAVIRLRHGRYQRPVTFMLLVMTLYLLCIFCLYNFTSFSQFAITFTSSNRMVLHIYPIYLFLFFLVLGTGFSTAPPQPLDSRKAVKTV